MASYLNYTELKKISKIIDTHTFVKNNKNCFDFDPDPPSIPEDSTESEYYHEEETKKELKDKERIAETIKNFRNSLPHRGDY